MSNPTALPSADLSLEDLAEIICAAGIVGDSARLAQGEAAFVAAQTYGHGCYMELSRKSKVNHKTLAERARVVEFYSGDDVTVGSSFARTILESNEGMVTWTMLREAKGLGDWQLAVDAIYHVIRPPD